MTCSEFNYTIANHYERVLWKLLAARARSMGNRACLKYKDERPITYAQLDETAKRVAMGFHCLGISKGDRVGLMATNSPVFFHVLFALSRLGAVLVPINIHHKGSLLRHVLATSDVRVLVIDNELVDVALDVVSDRPQPPLLVRLPAPRAALERGGIVNATTVLYEQDPIDFEVDVQHSDLQQILFTSGTTGPSKGVMITHNQTYAFADYVAQAMSMTENDTYYTCLPLFHINAQLTSIGAILNGACIALSDRFSARSFWSEIRQSGATAFSLFGAMSQILFNQAPSDSDTDHNVRVCWAFPAPYDILELFQDRFQLKILTAYASTEANFVAITDLSSPYRHGAAGRIHPRFEVSIVDEDDKPVALGSVGEIVTRSRDPFTMMLGYYRMPHETLASFRNLWFHTGDAGRLDEDGYLFFVDRVKDVIRRRGENVSSYEVEQVVNAHPGVLECAAVAVPSELAEDEIKIVIVPTTGSVIDPGEVVAFCRARMAYFMVPRFVQLVASLPKTPNGKVEKHKLAEKTEPVWDAEHEDALAPSEPREPAW